MITRFVRQLLLPLCLFMNATVMFAQAQPGSRDYTLVQT